MPLPKSVVKIKKNGVEYTSNVDRISYTLTELSRAALKDVGKLITKRTRQKIHKVTGKLAKNTRYSVRKKETALKIGFYSGGWYGIFQELGTSKQPKQAALQNAVLENIDEIRKIEGMYLKAVEDENKAKGLIDEFEDMGE